jgi:hypothetical protein
MANCPAFIPFEFTQRAIYVVRDPRDVALSFSRYLGLDLATTVEAMNNLEFNLSQKEQDGEILQTAQVVSSWSNHVKSYASETKFPVHFVRYEDLMAQPMQELMEILQFLGVDPDGGRLAAAVEATKLETLRQQEAVSGFRDNQHSKTDTFFGRGGSRWREELPPELAAQIVEDHRFVMQELGYVEDS